MLLIRYRIDPILIATVCIDDKSPSRHERIKSFLARLTNGKKPAEYYERHVKNLAFFGYFAEKEVDAILAICSGIENFAIKAPGAFIFMHLEFFKNPQSGTALRRLCIDYWRSGATNKPRLSFHPCFRNLTHLHLLDDYQNWPRFTGWETLTHLTHIAFASCETDSLQVVIGLLPAIRFVALCNAYTGDRYGYVDIVIHDSPELDLRVVVLSNFPSLDWEYGARGKGDFWNAVEDEVERRLCEGRAKHQQKRNFTVSPGIAGGNIYSI